MYQKVLKSNWCDKSKDLALETVYQYSEFLGKPVEKPEFKVYKNQESFVPSPEMVRRLVNRIRSLEVKAQVLIAIECGASASEVHNLSWKDVNLQEGKITVKGVKGHQTLAYPISQELTHILSLLPKKSGKIWRVKDPVNLGRNIRQYRRILFQETGNPDYLKLTFHSLRHFAISWFYFKTKDVVATQRFARHCNIQNTLKYVHIVKDWVKENEFVVVYAQGKEELTKYLSEGFELVAQTEWGYCLRKPKTVV